MNLPHLPQSVTVEVRDNLLFVGLTRPEKRNALSDETVLGLEMVFDEIPVEVGAVVLYGAGNHFCAGLDLSELKEIDAFEGIHHSLFWDRVFRKIQYGPVPVVAALHGAVVGGGLELASVAHIRVADRSTFFALPEGQRGIYVGGGASVNVERLIGTATMMDMMLTGRVLNAEEGVAAGLAQYLVDEGESLKIGIELAKKIGENAPATNFAITHVLPRISELGREPGILMESLMAGIAQSAPEAKARMRAFLEKRAKKVKEM